MRLRDLLPKDDGNVAVIVALSMIAIIGITALVIDAGVIFMAKNKLLNALDAGALAGADVMFQGQASVTSTAESYVSQNGESVDRVIINNVSNTVDLYRTINIPLYFGGVFGVSSVPYTAHVQAKIGSLVSGSGFAPIDVQSQSFVYGQEYTLSYGAGSGSTGNYGYLALGGNGACVFRDNLMYGYAGSLSVGEQVETETGVMSGPVSDAVNYRINESGSCTFSDATDACPRVLVLPVTSSSSKCGKSTVTIDGFAAFYLDGVSGSGGHQEIEGRFLQMIVPGEVGSSTNYGLNGVRLSL
jgi:hypothetical protein